jgi:hypothetical protein
MIYLAILKYVQTKTPGGELALRRELGKHAAGLDGIFLAASSYDIAPLVRMTIAGAALEKVPVDAFVRQRAYEIADADLRGIFRLLLKLASPEGTAERLWKAFNGYFEPCRAALDSVGRGRFAARMIGIPSCIEGFYVYAVEGFVTRALELAGAKGIKIAWNSPVDDPDGGATTGIAMETRWS